jgi:murein L,D-transpeptidase YafK
MPGFKAALFRFVCLLCLLPTVHGQTPSTSKNSPTTQRDAAKPGAPSPASLNDSEARLLEIYRLTSAGQTDLALEQAAKLARDYPNFQLAQLVYGDLLMARARPLRQLGDVPDPVASNKSEALDALREESRRRVKAFNERPPEGTIPSAFLTLAKANKHAIAVDAAKSRLYLFEHQNQQLKLVADFYVSVGKQGTDKTTRGDLRTPVGVYFITGAVDAKQLPDFYGAGALPINYPNMLDARRGKTGSGIWLHGTPSNQHARAPLATDGCLVLANNDLNFLLKTVEPKTTPVLIAQQLEWLKADYVAGDHNQFEHAFMAWRTAKSRGELSKTLSFYTPDFNSFGKDLKQWKTVLQKDMSHKASKRLAYDNVSLLRWADHEEVMMVTFDESPHQGAAVTKRQYWIRQANHWKIFFEGIIG